jgi:hypothetical protein
MCRVGKECPSLLQQDTESKKGIVCLTSGVCIQYTGLFYTLTSDFSGSLLYMYEYSTSNLVGTPSKYNCTEYGVDVLD